MVGMLTQIALRNYGYCAAVGTPPPDSCRLLYLLHGFLYPLHSFSHLATGAETARAEGYALALYASDEWVG